jgi:hypothetical protein
MSNENKQIIIERSGPFIMGYSEKSKNIRKIAFKNTQKRIIESG